MQVFLGSMVGQYNSTSYFDDLAWAAAWLFKATKDPAYLNDAVKYFNKHTYGEVHYLLSMLIGASNWHLICVLRQLTKAVDTSML